jgi:capsular polysaccharide transport system permease protein
MGEPAPIPQVLTSPAGRVLALMRRDRDTRFSGGVLGYVWAYLIPFSWIAFVVALFELTGRAPPIHTDPALFVATGLLPYILFRQTVSSMMRGVIAHRRTLHVSPLKLSDLLLASAAQELVNLAVSALLVFGVILLVTGADGPDDPIRVLLGLLLAWSMGVGLGRLVSVLGLMSDLVARSVPILLRPTFWISGIFFTATELPGALRDLLWWSPLLHATERIRDGWFAGYSSPFDSLSMLIVPALLPWVLSFLAEAVLTRRRLSRYAS